MTQLTTAHTRTAARPVQSKSRVSRLEELFHKDDFLRTVLIGCAGGFGLSTLVILFSLELSTLRTGMTEHLGAWWFMVPTLTVIGFFGWTFMLVRIRRDRLTKILRKEAFARHADSSPESGASTIKQATDPARADSDQPESWL